LDVIDTTVSARYHLARLHIDAGRPETALLLSEEALAAALSRHVELSEAAARGARGRALAALGRANEARREWGRAAGIYDGLGSAAAEDMRQLLMSAPAFTGAVTRAWRMRC